MKHLKLTFVGLLALTAAASDAFAQGPPGPPPGGPPMGGPPMGGLRRWVAAYRVCRAVAHPVSQVARWAAAYPVSRAVDPSATSRQAPREMLPGMSRQAL